MKFRISFICLIIINISLCTLFLEYGQGFISNTFNKKLTSHFRINFRLKLFFNLTFLLHKMVCREISGYSSNTRGKPKKFISRRANNACFIAWKYNDNYTWDIIGIAWVGFQNGAWVAQKRLCKNDCAKTIVQKRLYIIWKPQRILNERLRWKYENISIMEILCYGKDFNAPFWFVSM